MKPAVNRIVSAAPSPRIEILERRTLLSAGDLDFSFGAGGVVSSPLAGQADAIAVQPDGKILVAAAADGHFSVVRFTVTGTVDASFGNGGVAEIATSSARARSVAIQSDGKILVAGDDFLLARFTASGQLDSNFGNLGVAPPPALFPPNFGEADVVLAAPGNKIVLIGALGSNVGIARYTSAGQPDSTFSFGGALSTGPSQGIHVTSGAVQPDGKIIVGGYVVNGSASGYVLGRINSDGSPDATFGNFAGTGWAIENWQANLPHLFDVNDLVLAPDGSIVVVGGGVPASGGTTFAAAGRFTSSGLLDTSFGVDGGLTPLGFFLSDAARAIAIDAAGKFVIGGYFSTNDGADLGLTRLHADGVLDKGFGPPFPPAGFSPGTVVTPAGGAQFSTDVAIAPSGQIILAADERLLSPNIAYLARYDGSSAPNIAPISVPGSYKVGEGSKLTLNGSKSSDADGAVRKYAWDFNYDGVNFQTDATGASPVFDATALDGPAIRNIALRVTDDEGATTMAAGGITITNVRPQLNISSTQARVSAGSIYTLSLAAFGDPGPDTIFKWTITWGDGQVQTVNGNPSSVTHVYSAAGTYPISATAADEDGTYSANDGGRDKGFNAGAPLPLHFSTSDWFTATLPLPNGKIVVGGRSGTDFQLARYNADGTLDTTFGTNGRVTTDFAPLLGMTSSDEAIAVLSLGPNGEILAAGREWNQTFGFRYAVARYTASGQLDTSFGSGGRVLTPVLAGPNSDALLTGLAVRANGAVLINGAAPGPTPGRYSDLTLFQFTANGSPDLTFGGDGKVQTDFGNTSDFPAGLALLPDGSVLTGGVAVQFGAPESSQVVILARYTPTGALDASFGSGGTIKTPTPSMVTLSYPSLSLTSDGRIVIAAQGQSASTYENDVFVARFTAAGALDPSFSGDGQLGWDIDGSDSFQSAVVGPDGSIYLCGYCWPDSYNALHSFVGRLTPDGATDHSFGPVGWFGSEGTPGLRDVDLYQLALDSAGRLIAVGNAHDLATNSSGGVLERFLIASPSVAVGGQISGTLYNDLNGNGVRDSGEPGIGGRTIYNDADNDKVLDAGEIRTVTDAAGNYVLPGLSAGAYKIRQLRPAGWTQTTPANDFGWTINLTANQLTGGRDFGAIGPDVSMTSSSFDVNAHQAMRFTFNAGVSASLAAGDLQLVNQTTGATVNSGAIGVSYDAATNTATLIYSGVLPDGNYRALIPASAVTDAAGSPLSAPATLDFFILAGDANHDRVVDTLDFNSLAANFGGAGKLFSQGDFNYDGVVDTLDFNALAGSFGKSLAVPAGPSFLTQTAAGQTEPRTVFSSWPVRGSAPRWEQALLSSPQ